MIESIENAFQITILLVCAAVALRRAISLQSKAWTLLFFFYGTWLLGDIYWLVCLVFYGETPQISIISELNWYASYTFLYFLLLQVSPPSEKHISGILPWLCPVFSIIMAVFYMQWGKIIDNLILAALMGLLLFSVTHRLADRKHYVRSRFICWVILFFCLMDYGLWTSSCFVDAYNDKFNLYYLFDILLSLGFVFFLPSVKKAAKV